jgi:hypothetical protein
MAAIHILAPANPRWYDCESQVLNRCLSHVPAAARRGGTRKDIGLSLGAAKDVLSLRRP